MFQGKKNNNCRDSEAKITSIKNLEKKKEGSKETNRPYSNRRSRKNKCGSSKKYYPQAATITATAITNMVAKTRLLCHGSGSEKNLL